MSGRRDHRVGRELEHYGHFRRAVREFVPHYHGERDHQGLQNRLITGAAAIGTGGRVRRRSRLGGLLNYYERVA
jgi:putative transposase